MLANQETRPKERISALIITRNLLVILLISLIFMISNYTKGFCQNDKLNKILQEISSSDDFLKRRAAQNELTEYLDNTDDANRGEVIDRLLLKIRDKKNSSTRLRTGISYSIGQIKSFFWKVKDQEKAEQNLYVDFQQEKDPALKKNMDSALMKAEGLYWDAIHGYNYDKPITNAIINKNVQKFRHVFVDYPESSYASKAHYYLARYYTRVYLIKKYKGWQADKHEFIAKKSNSTYENYFKMVKEGKYEPSETMDAHYYLALNYVLLGEIENAIKEMEKIRKSQIKNEYLIYVYEFYFSNDNENVKNRYYPADQLAEYTIKYLKEHLKYDDNYQEAFVAYLNKFEPKEPKD